jgi:hypothetical protein
MQQPGIGSAPPGFQLWWGAEIEVRIEGFEVLAFGPQRRWLLARVLVLWRCRSRGIPLSEPMTLAPGGAKQPSSNVLCKNVVVACHR